MRRLEKLSDRELQLISTLLHSDARKTVDFIDQNKSLNINPEFSGALYRHLDLSQQLAKDINAEFECRAR